ncbi:transcriptional regulator [Jannaschia donghaensis]|uniref:Mobile mystery protein A n=1 Tax=Jannaschia donghaensis TaxID=420998 RepID=A0A0M6YMT4_9RHOB|nr:transcriptional regulator [Jannaschia donghaensis]CTQ51250.1 mobile mystery protein A [Jannaschia donghaensis]
MPNFIERRRLARMLDRTAEQVADTPTPEKGWISAMRTALGMSAEQVAIRKGVSRNAVYQAERSEQDGGVSLNQMDKIAAAMGARFIYAIVPNAPIEQLKYQQALLRARSMAADQPEFASWSMDDQQDWIDDTAAQQLHDMPPDFWDNR